ncbi:MAG: glycosyltransferase [Candidatus Omnitrophica bacterium]|nr:glycosyltransferase [Candidatus Omnitrophota bacterium]MBU1924073.1 glycosyltransferase [Candidatus Omnitrophota bacterium]
MDISVVIPSFNRKFKLKECLDSLFAQVYPKDSFEVIVIDDGSSDGSKDMLEALSKTNPNLKYFIQQHKGPAVARNLGVRHAKGGIIGFTDSDCILDKNWIGLMVQAHRLKEHVAAVGGVTEVNSSNIKARVSQFLSDGAIETIIDGKSETIFFPTCNVSFKRQYILDGFNEFFPLPAGEDLDFFWRLFKDGKRFSYDRQIKVFHNCHTDFISFLKQAYMYGRGNYLVQHMHKDHPLLKEIKTENTAYFIYGSIVNFLKIPRFSYLLGKRLASLGNQPTLFGKFKIFLYFSLHKTNYLTGNMTERIRVTRIAQRNLKNKIGFEEIPVRPEFIILDITHRCNLKCNICEIRKDKPAGEYTLEEIENLIKEAIDWGVKEFVLSGGEPFVREDIFEILDFVKERGYRIGVLTNGIMLNEDFIDKLLPYFIAGSLSLSISLDALSPGIHDEIRGARGSHEKTLNGLKILSCLKKKHPNINFNTISIILNENLEELFGLAVFLRSLNVNSIQFQPLLSNNLVMKERSGSVKYWIPRERLDVLDAAIDKLIEFKRSNYQLVRNSENNLSLSKKYFRGYLAQGDVKCLYAVKTILVANNGDVTTCFESYGNIRTASLKKIFGSEKSKQARKKVAECRNPCLLPCFCD